MLAYIYFEVKDWQRCQVSGKKNSDTAPDDRFSASAMCARVLACVTWLKAKQSLRKYLGFSKMKLKQQLYYMHIKNHIDLCLYIMYNKNI